MKKISNAVFTDLIDQIWLNFLQQATPEDIYQSVISSNWDGNQYLLNWILNHAEVDQAVILAIYWMSGVRYLKQYKNREEVLEKASWSIESYDYLQQLEQKYLNGFWKNQNFAYDPSHDHDEYNWVTEYAEIEIQQEIPEKMLQVLEGKHLTRSSKFEDGLPEPFLSQVWALFDEYEIEDELG